MPPSIDLSNPEFVLRLRRLCAENGCDATALARASDVGPKVVSGLMRGARDSASKETLERMAAALSVSYEYLVHGVDDRAVVEIGDLPPSPRRSRARVVATSIAILATFWFLARLLPTILPPDMEIVGDCNDSVIGVQNQRTYAMMWEEQLNCPVTLVREIRWGNRRAVLFGTAACAAESGTLEVRDMATGDTLWTEIPQILPMCDWYPAGTCDTGRFQPHPSCQEWPDCNSSCFYDVTRDGENDLVVLWQWVPWYPTIVTLYPSFGKEGLVGAPRYYRTCGRVTFAEAFNVDDDPQVEILCAATNNAAAIQGVMLLVLDDTHWVGGTVDSLSNLTHWAPNHGLDDSSLARLVLPQFDSEFMIGFDQLRLDPSKLQIREDDQNGLIITLGVGNNPLAWVTLTLDSRLEVIDFEINPEAQAKLNAVSPGLGDRFDESYIRKWLERRMRFGVDDIGRHNNPRRHARARAQYSVRDPP